MNVPDWLPAALLAVYILAVIALAAWPIIHPLNPPSDDDQ